MKNENTSYRLDHISLGIPLAAVLAIWIVYWLEVKFGFFLNPFGIQPKSLIGLRGIFCSPFIHGSIEHLYSNTIPLFLLSLALFYFYRKLAFKVLLWGWLGSGFLTWLIADHGTTHIGASGVIYVLASFLFFKGIWSKHYRLVSLSLIIVFIYGSLVWGVLPGVPGVSWEGHLSGFITGIALAFIYRKVKVIEIKKYDWQKETYSEEEDEFMKHFDEDGNFIPSSEMESFEEESSDSTANMAQVKIIYELKENKNKD